MSNIAEVTKLKITNTKLYVSIVTLSSKDNVKLVKLLEEGFKRLHKIFSSESKYN